MLQVSNGTISHKADPNMETLAGWNLAHNNPVKIDSNIIQWIQIMAN